MSRQTPTLKKKDVDALIEKGLYIKADIKHDLFVVMPNDDRRYWCLTWHRYVYGISSTLVLAPSIIHNDIIHL